MEADECQFDEDGDCCDSEEEGLQFSGDEGDVEEREIGTSSSQTLTPDMISKKMFEIISEVNDVFQVVESLPS